MQTRQYSYRNPPAPLRHPMEIPFYIFCVILNLSIVGIILFLGDQVQSVGRTLRSVPFGSDVANVLGGSIWSLIVIIPTYIILREYLRAQTRGNAILLSREQFPDVYATLERFAEDINLKERFDKKQKKLELYLQNGNGVLNAFAAQASFMGFITIYSELFSDLYENDRDGLYFILGHEMAHIKLWHTNLFYLLSLAFVSEIPIIGTTMSRLREYSCDRHGALLSPNGISGLFILTAGRTIYRQVDTAEYLRQAPRQRGWIIWLAQLITASHPYMSYRIPVLFDLGFMQRPPDAPAFSPTPPDAPMGPIGPAFPEPIR